MVPFILRVIRDTKERAKEVKALVAKAKAQRQAKEAAQAQRDAELLRTQSENLQQELAEKRVSVTFFLKSKKES